MEKVSTFKIFCMVVESAVCLALFLVPLIRIRRQRGASRRQFFIGGASYLFFGIGMRYMLLQTFTDEFGDITTKRFAYALFSGIAAAVINEGGRYITLRFVNRKHDQQRDALMFGTGYGGTEAIFFSGIAAFFGFTFASVINNGQIDDLVESFDASMQDTVRQQIESMYAMSGWDFLVSTLECCIVFVLEVSLSIIMFKCAYEKKSWKLFLTCAGIHLVYSFVAQILTGLIPAIVIEVILACIAGFAAYLAHKVFPSIKEDEENDDFWDSVD
ncbi:MAG: YhfC family glutamic-type intramembrane protease [Oscillospiraceae bacterium]|jgi:uncharacterized membrane protein YhfC